MDNETAENRIMEVLSDPEKMQQVISIAESLGFPPPDSGRPAPQELSAAAELLQQSAPDGRQEALLHALLPYLRPGRRKKLERALQLARLSQIAELALRREAEQQGG